MDEACFNCRFFQAGSTKAEIWKDVGGMCRRYAPQGPAICSGGAWQVFPPMSPTQWCGDYRPKQETAALASRIAA
jgi:hypothetical protein